MNPEQWQKVKKILEEVLETETSERSKRLDELCADNRELHAEVESLLAFEQNKNTTDPLEKSAVSHISENKLFKDLVGKNIGRYKIVGELGAGGMGAVYLAERMSGGFEQKAALKLIKRGMDSDAILHRFLNERQILASLKHPNIAHLIDGGTTGDGLPFFVMEYVEGANILEYADAENLALDARLDLFREICAAVSFAHRNLIIHRDLKPSNILVTKDGNVKLLDFGISKILKSEDEGDALTATHLNVFTPEYASPEQINGEKLTTATDIYSLGVILYELLTGNRPYKTDSKNIGAIIKAICETEPTKPSAVQTSKAETRSSRSRFKTRNSKLLKGDLDNIILKALRKESERRYSSVEQFSEDIYRFQNGLPVSASRDSWSYRASKFIRRNRAAVVSAVMVVVILIAGIAGMTWQTVKAERAREEAERERERAEKRSENLRKISNSLVGEIERAIRDLPGSLPARQMLLARAVEQLDALAAEADGDTGLQLELVWAYQNLATLPDKKISESDRIYRKALILMDKIFESGKADAEAKDRLAMIYLDMIYTSRLRGDADFTLEYNKKSVAIVEEIFRAAPDKASFKDSFWTANYHYALTMMQLGKAGEIIETGRKILPVAEELHRTNPPDTDKYNFMKPHLTRLAIGSGLIYAGEYETALVELKKALEECRAEQKIRPDEQILLRNEANIISQTAVALENSGNFEDGFNEAQKSLEIREKLKTRNPTDLNFQMLAADGEFLIGQMLARKNQNAAAVTHLKRALEVYEKINQTDEDRGQTQALAAAVKSFLGDTFTKTGKTNEGQKIMREAVAFFESANAARTIDANLKSRFAQTLENLANALNPVNPNESRELYQKSLTLWKELQTSGTIKKADIYNIEEISRRLENLKNF